MRNTMRNPERAPSKRNQTRTQGPAQAGSLSRAGTGAGATAAARVATAGVGLQSRPPPNPYYTYENTKDANKTAAKPSQRALAHGYPGTRPIEDDASSDYILKAIVYDPSSSVARASPNYGHPRYAEGFSPLSPSVYDDEQWAQRQNRSRSRSPSLSPIASSFTIDPLRSSPVSPLEPEFQQYAPFSSPPSPQSHAPQPTAPPPFAGATVPIQRGPEQERKASDATVFPGHVFTPLPLQLKSPEQQTIQKAQGKVEKKPVNLSHIKTQTPAVKKETYHPDVFHARPPGFRDFYQEGPPGEGDALFSLIKGALRKKPKQSSKKGQGENERTAEPDYEVSATLQQPFSSTRYSDAVRRTPPKIYDNPKAAAKTAALRAVGPIQEETRFQVPDRQLRSESGREYARHPEEARALKIYDNYRRSKEAARASNDIKGKQRATERTRTQSSAEVPLTLSKSIEAETVRRVGSPVKPLPAVPILDPAPKPRKKKVIIMPPQSPLPPISPTSPLHVHSQVQSSEVNYAQEAPPQRLPRGPSPLRSPPPPIVSPQPGPTREPIRENTFEKLVELDRLSKEKGPKRPSLFSRMRRALVSEHQEFVDAEGNFALTDRQKRLKAKISKPEPLLATNGRTANVAPESGGIGGPHAARSLPVRNGVYVPPPPQPLKVQKAKGKEPVHWPPPEAASPKAREPLRSPQPPSIEPKKKGTAKAQNRPPTLDLPVSDNTLKRSPFGSLRPKIFTPLRSPNTPSKAAPSKEYKNASVFNVKYADWYDADKSTSFSDFMSKPIFRTGRERKDSDLSFSCAGISEEYTGGEEKNDARTQTKLVPQLRVESPEAEAVSPKTSTHTWDTGGINSPRHPPALLGTPEFDRSQNSRQSTRTKRAEMGRISVHHHSPAGPSRSPTTTKQTKREDMGIIPSRPVLAGPSKSTPTIPRRERSQRGITYDRPSQAGPSRAQTVKPPPSSAPRRPPPRPRSPPLQRSDDAGRRPRVPTYFRFPDSDDEREEPMARELPTRRIPRMESGERIVSRVAEYEAESEGEWESVLTGDRESMVDGLGDVEIGFEDDGGVRDTLFYRPVDEVLEEYLRGMAVEREGSWRGKGKL